MLHNSSALEASHNLPYRRKMTMGRSLFILLLCLPCRRNFVATSSQSFMISFHCIRPRNVLLQAPSVPTNAPY